MTENGDITSEILSFLKLDKTSNEIRVPDLVTALRHLYKNILTKTIVTVDPHRPGFGSHKTLRRIRIPESGECLLRSLLLRRWTGESNRGPRTVE